MKLTKRILDAATYHDQGGTHYLWDDDLAGFGVRIYPTGRKSFLVTYRVKGRQRFQTVGKVGELTLQQARKIAMEILVEVRHGHDPSGERQARSKAPTMADLATRFMVEHAHVKKKPSSAKTDDSMWKLYVLPKLKKRKVADITREDVAKLHTALSKTPYAANRMLELLRKSFNLAEIWGWRRDGSNPCRHIQKYKEEKRERYLSRDELARLAETLNTAEALGAETPATIAALRLLIFTGCRLGEILKLRWAEVHFERRFLRLADSKTGRKTIYLNAPALELLANIDRPDDNPYVIRGLKPDTHLVNLKDPWYRLRKQAGIDDVRIHDLRHTFASFGAGAGLSLPLLGKMLGHSQPATTQRYAHLAADPVLWAVDRVGAELQAAMEGGKGRPEPSSPTIVEPIQEEWLASLTENQPS